MAHIALHFLVPMALAVAAYRPEWRSAAGIMLFTMAVDGDHLLAVPIYDPQRCSIGFHPLHGAVPIGVYLLLAAVPLLERRLGTAAPGSRRVRGLRVAHLVGVGLLVHMALDAIDCVA